MSSAKLEKKLCLAKENPEPVFDLSDCDIKRIPKGIFSVIKVFRKELLYLQDNKLSSLQEGGDLRDLYLLKLLDLRSNKISKLPSDIQYLKNLQVLRVDNNELTSLPSEIGSLINLEQLTVSSNRLKLLPDSIGDLRNLQHLDLRSNNQLHSLPATIYKNKQLQVLLLDDDREWIEPPTSVVRSNIPAIITYFAQKRCSSEIGKVEIVTAEEFSPSERLHQLSIYDKFIQDNLRRLEKEKEDKLSQKIETERSILNQKENELLMRQQSQKEKKKLITYLAQEQQRIDKEIGKCHKRRDEEKRSFIQQLQNVENLADEVIEQLLKTTNAQKQKSVSSVIPTLFEEIPIKQNLHQEKILESMEQILAEEFMLSVKLKENDIARQNIIRISNLNDQRVENKIFNLLSERRSEHCALIESIQEDTSLQYAAVLALIQKSDSRNVELQNQISVVQSQLSNLTAMELRNKNLSMNRHINDLVERRIILTNLLQDIFSQQQSRRKELIDQLRDVENFQSSMFQSKDNYWLIQFQRLLNSSYLSVACRSIDSALICELALFGVSHYAPLLSTFEPNSIENLSKITDGALEEIGIESFEDRCSILNAIQHFINDRCRANVLPSAPMSGEAAANFPFSDDNDSNSTPSISPSAPNIENANDSKSTANLSNVLPNECVICLDNQSSIVFLPCGHLCSCSKCSLCINQCPMCRCDIDKKMQIYSA